MKKRISLSMILMMILCLAVPLSSGSASYGVRIMVNGTYVDFSGGYGQPFISDEGRTLVPVRGTAEAYGCEVEWDALRYRVVVNYESHSVIIPVNESYITTETGTVYMDTYARIIEDRTYLPIRYVMEALGAAVEWDAANRTVIIRAPDIVNDDGIVPDNTFAPSDEPSASEPYVSPVQTADNDPSLTALKNSLKSRGKYDSASGYIYQETTPANTSLESKLVYDPVRDLIYVLVEMDLDGSSGNSYYSLKLSLNGSSYTTAYYSFDLLNSGTDLSWFGHFEKNRYTDSSGYVIDQASSQAKDIGASMMLNHLAVYQAGIAVQAVDRYCSSYVNGVTASSFGFSQ